MTSRVGYDDLEIVGIDAGRRGGILEYQGLLYTDFIEERIDGILVSEGEFTNRLLVLNLMKNLLSLLLAFISCVVLAQSPPLRLAEELISLKKEESFNYYEQGFKRYPDFQLLKKKSTLSVESFRINGEFEVVKVTAKEPSGKGSEMYLYFRRNGNIWKVVDIASLESTNSILQWNLLRLQNLTKSQVDSVLNTNTSQKLFKSKEHYNYLINIYSLGLEPDENIIKYFELNKAKFVALKIKFDNYVNRNPEYSDFEKNKFLSTINYGNLTLSDVSANFSGLGNCLVFVVAKNSYGVVGYFYSPTKLGIPEISPRKILFVQEIGDGWYFFRSK